MILQKIALVAKIGIANFGITKVVGRERKMIVGIFSGKTYLKSVLK